jgi:hypothetical protein
MNGDSYRLSKAAANGTRFPTAEPFAAERASQGKSLFRYAPEALSLRKSLLDGSYY